MGDCSELNQKAESNDKADCSTLNCKANAAKEVASKVIRVGSRKSELALVQTNFVIAELRKLYPDQKFEIHKMTTVGDRVLNISLPKIGEKSLFTKDLEDALRNGVVDFVVHSLKDLPTALPDGMAIGAVLEREDARDALVLAKHHEGKTLATLPEGSVIGTSSLRRTAQISRSFPHLKVHDIRGNLNTRLAKLDAPDSKFAGIILAKAGLERMGWHNRISKTIEPSEMLYAVGQGALAVECRSSDKHILEMLRKLVCHQTQCRILAERSFLKTLGGGCSAPVAVHSTLSKRECTESGDSDDFELKVVGSVWSLDGKIEIQATNACTFNLNGEQDASPPPSKRMKLTIDIEDTAGDAPSGNKLSPPQVIDHSQETNKNLDIAGFLNTHIDVFKKCPYSSVLQKADNATATETNAIDAQSSPDDNPALKCPLNFPVGHDVMGECPYFNAATKQHGSDSSTTTSNQTCSSTTSSGCPFRIGCGGSDKTPLNVLGTDVAKCPFLAASNTTSVIVENVNRTNKTEIENETAIERLFCGLFPHRRWPMKLFEKCEQLGQDLAAQLIEKGALSVMECAQNEIRQKS